MGEKYEAIDEKPKDCVWTNRMPILLLPIIDLVASLFEISS